VRQRPTGLEILDIHVQLSDAILITTASRPVNNEKCSNKNSHYHDEKLRYARAVRVLHHDRESKNGEHNYTTESERHVDLYVSVTILSRDLKFGQLKLPIE
jgi:hypothetical protein